jgi:aquaporin Z
VRKTAAEFLGTFILVFTGTAAGVVDLQTHALTSLGIALAWGLAVMAMIYALGESSGAHLNPAITLGFFAARRFPAKGVLPYIVAQCAGALLASALLKLLFPASPSLGETLPAGSALQSCVVVGVLTFIRMFVALAVATGPREIGVLAGIAVGGTVALDALVGGPISGASMNPARSLAPALVSGHLHHLWIYLTAPFLGALLAIPACRMTRAGASHAAGPAAAGHSKRAE